MRLSVIAVGYDDSHVVSVAEGNKKQYFVKYQVDDTSNCEWFALQSQAVTFKNRVETRNKWLIAHGYDN